MTASLKSLGVISVMMLCLLALPVSLSWIVDEHTLVTVIAQYRPQTISELVLATVLSALLLAIGLPRQVIAFGFGFMLGPLLGTFLATIATLTALALTYFCSFYFLRAMLIKHYRPKVSIVEQFFSEDTFVKALMIRLIPAGSNFITNIIAGAGNAPFSKYFAGSALGFLPQMLLFTLLGAGAKIGNNMQIIVSIVLLICSTLLFSYLFRKHKRQIANFSN